MPQKSRSSLKCEARGIFCRAAYVNMQARKIPGNEAVEMKSGVFA
jgi:hypothetical protein